jgi:hypothetical protein
MRQERCSGVDGSRRTSSEIRDLDIEAGSDIDELTKRLR